MLLLQAYCQLFFSISLTSSLLFSVQAALTLFTRQPYELLAALMYSQYSFYHINTATVCQDSGGRGAKEKE